MGCYPPRSEPYHSKNCNWLQYLGGIWREFIDVEQAQNTQVSGFHYGMPTHSLTLLPSKGGADVLFTKPS